MRHGVEPEGVRSMEYEAPASCEDGCDGYKTEQVATTDIDSSDTIYRVRNNMKTAAATVQGKGFSRLILSLHQPLTIVPLAC